MGIAVLIVGYVGTLVGYESYEQHKLLSAWDTSHPAVNDAQPARSDVFVTRHPHLADGEAIFKLAVPSINFTAVRRTTQALLPGMIERRWGRILCVTGSAEPSGVNAAVAAKAGVHAWAKGLSREIGRNGITINCLSPGRVHSEQIDQRLHPTPESQAEFARNIPLGYFGDPSDVAFLAAFLCSPKARYITGERIHVDGGLHRAV